MSRLNQSSALSHFKRTHKGLIGIVLGALVLVGGAMLISFPQSMVLFHPSEGFGFLERVTKSESRAYGFLAVIFGGGLLWLARWPRWGRRSSAIDDYVWGLSQELSRRLGPREYYTVSAVTDIATRSGYSLAHLPYAHALFCCRADFEAYYRSREVACAYDRLRSKIVRRYFGGVRGVNAASVIHFTKPPQDEEYSFYEGGG